MRGLKLDKADVLFSKFIRLRDKHCVRCLKGGSGIDGIDGLQCSHYYGRRRENTRFDPENCDSLCFGCHQEWGSTDREAYREFKIKQLGKKGFDLLQMRANTMKKKDRRMALIVIKELLKTLEE